MKIILSQSELDELPEEHRSSATEDGDGFVIEGDTALLFTEDVSGLKSALQREREARREAEGKLKATRRRSEDRVSELESQLRALDGVTPETMTQLRTERDEAIAARDAAVESRDSMFRDAELTEAITKAGGNLEVLRPALAARIKADEKGALRVFDADGKTATLNADGQPMTVAELVASYRDNPSWSGVFAGTNQSGSGSPPMKGGEGRQHTNGDATNDRSKYPARRSEFTQRQKVDFQKAFGLDALLDLPA